MYISGSSTIANATIANPMLYSGLIFVREICPANAFRGESLRGDAASLSSAVMTGLILCDSALRRNIERFAKSPNYQAFTPIDESAARLPPV
jgi:hypothetical protein